MTIEEAIEILEPAYILDEDLFRVLKAAEIAVSALRSPQNAANDPLTLEELRGMGVTAMSTSAINDYGKTWMAYRCRPEEVN